jgi:hypothetical protein
MSVGFWDLEEVSLFDFWLRFYDEILYLSRDKYLVK